MGIYFLLRFLLKLCCSLNRTLKARQVWIVHRVCLRHCVFRAESNYCHLVSQFQVLCYWKLLVFHLCLQGGCMSCSHFFLVYFPCIFTVCVLTALSVCPQHFPRFCCDFLLAWLSLLFNGVLVYIKSTLCSILFSSVCTWTKCLFMVCFGTTVTDRLHEK